MKSYKFCTVSGQKEFNLELHNFPVADISIYPWDTAPHSLAYAVLAAGKDALYVFMRSEEKDIRAIQTEQNGPIYTDSCLEFFLMPSLQSNLYLNIEANPKGVIYFSVGKEREGRLLITEEGPEDLQMEAQVHPAQYGGNGWCVRYNLPYKLIQKYVPEFNPLDPLSMRGNFYKCGDGLSQPHWGMWSKVGTEKPDFHRPEYFGSIIQG